MVKKRITSKNIKKSYFNYLPDPTETISIHVLHDEIPSSETEQGTRFSIKILPLSVADSVVEP